MLLQSAQNSIPIIGRPKNIKKAEKSQLAEIYSYYKNMGDEWIKRQVLEYNRIDILTVAVLNYELKPFHLRMQRFQFMYADTLQLAFRGSGKTTVCTITKAIHLLLKNPNLRILLASKTTGRAEDFLREIKGHFESNDKLTEIFGPYYDKRKVDKWDTNEINVLPRTSRAKEASITCVGVGSAIVGKHYDAILSDDLVDEENSRTEIMRKKTQTWYYQTLDPTLEPPDKDIPHRGEHHRLGTRYHYMDLWGHLIENELKEQHQIIRALNEKGQSPWPEKFPPDFFAGKRKKSGIIIFNAQFQCDTEAMKGEIFQYDDCQLIKEEDVPDDVMFFIGIDLAITEDEKKDNDNFALCVTAMDKMKNYYVYDYIDRQLKFSKQTKKIIKYYDKYDVVRACIETNAYQKAQYHNVKDKRKKEGKTINLKPVNQDKDKITRAWKLTGLFEDKKIFFVKSGKAHHIIERIVLFPNGKKDLFDALDLSIRASKIKKRRPRSKVGLI
jgi:predicted phage terminase large subunit-like protein